MKNFVDMHIYLKHFLKLQAITPGVVQKCTKHRESLGSGHLIERSRGEKGRTWAACRSLSNLLIVKMIYTSTLCTLRTRSTPKHHNSNIPVQIDSNIPIVVLPGNDWSDLVLPGTETSLPFGTS